MTKTSILLLFSLFILGHNSFGQKQEKLTYFVGIGPVVDGNIGLWGNNFTNELSFKVGKRTSINPSLTFYHSVGSFDQSDDPNLNQDNSSGIFTNATFKYNLIKIKKDFKISAAFGPSFQLGSENFLAGIHYNQGEPPDYRYRIEKFNRLGLTQQISFDWASKNINRWNSATVSISSFGGYWPWYLMATYRIGFKLK